MRDPAKVMSFWARTANAPLAPVERTGDTTCLGKGADPIGNSAAGVERELKSALRPG
jgi:hypothetical protein